MRSCANCAYKDLLITEEPCMRCRYNEYWEADEDKEDEENVEDNI